MIFDKKGLSTVVTTLIIILLVLVAIGIIWVVIRGVVEETSTATDVSVECLKIDVRAVPGGVVCTNVANADSCTVALSRKAGGVDIGGVKLVFHNDSTSSNVFDSKDYGLGSGNITVLTSKTTSAIATGLANGTSNKVEVTVYLLDASGAEQICTQTYPLSY